MKAYMPWKPKIVDDVHIIHVVQWIFSVPEDTSPPD